MQNDCLIVAHPRLMFSRLNFIDFWGQHRSIFAFKFLGWPLYCTLSNDLSSAPLTLSSPYQFLLCSVHTQKIHLLFSNEKNLISIEGGLPIVRTYWNLCCTVHLFMTSYD